MQKKYKEIRRSEDKNDKRKISYDEQLSYQREYQIGHFKNEISYKTKTQKKGT